MGERSSTPRSDVTTPRAIEREVDFLRQRTETLLSELEGRLGVRLGEARTQVGRLRPAFEVAVFFRRHKAAAILVSASTLFLLARATQLFVRGQRRLLGRMIGRTARPEVPRFVPRRLFGRALEGALLAMLLALVTEPRA
jgi:hypothetical protein